MSDVVIKAENIGKKYTIGHQAERGGYTSLRDVLIDDGHKPHWVLEKVRAKAEQFKEPVLKIHTLREVAQ